MLPPPSILDRLDALERALAALLDKQEEHERCHTQADNDEQPEQSTGDVSVERNHESS